MLASLKGIYYVGGGRVPDRDAVPDGARVLIVMQCLMMLEFLIENQFLMVLEFLMEMQFLMVLEFLVEI